MPTRALLALPLAAAAAAVLLPATARTAAPPASHAVTVSPFPGTPDASAQTQISFLGAHGTRVMTVRAVGSRSGYHAGRIEEYSTGEGASFLPKRAFDAGETVRVTAVVAGGSATATARTTFTIATQPRIDKAGFPAQPGNPADVQHYLSAPMLTPSTVSITTPARAGASPGDLFLAPYQGAGTPGPMITDQRGNLVWFHPLPRGEFATNFRPQRFDGRTVLTWWQGRILALGFGHAGVDEIYSSSYRPLAAVRAGNGYSADLHEFLLGPDGTAWIDAFDPVETDLQRLGGSRRAIVTDSVVQEIDIKTGLVMWEWHALGHIPLADAYTRRPPRDSHRPWDYVHINSIDPGSGGQLLLSSRNTSALWDVSRANGGVIWTLGGRHSSFSQGPGTVFDFQHDARWQADGRVSLFDDGYVVTHDTPSRGLLLDLDLANHRVSLVKSFANPLIHLQTESQGDLVRLPGDDWLVGYGGIPNFTEVDDSGHVLLDGTLGPFVENYRTYLAPWSGSPDTRPAVAAQLTAGGMEVEASWNGATGVASWEVLAGSSAGSLKTVATAPSSGFETTAHVAAAGYVAVAARNANGRTLASSAPISVGG